MNEKRDKDSRQDSVSRYKYRCDSVGTSSSFESSQISTIERISSDNHCGLEEFKTERVQRSVRRRRRFNSKMSEEGIRLRGVSRLTRDDLEKKLSKAVANNNEFIQDLNTLATNGENGHISGVKLVVKDRNRSDSMTNAVTNGSTNGHSRDLNVQSTNGHCNVERNGHIRNDQDNFVSNGSSSKHPHSDSEDSSDSSVGEENLKNIRKRGSSHTFIDSIVHRFTGSWLVEPEYFVPEQNKSKLKSQSKEEDSR